MTAAFVAFVQQEDYVTERKIVLILPHYFIVWCNAFFSRKRKRIN